MKPTASQANPLATLPQGRNKLKKRFCGGAQEILPKVCCEQKKNYKTIGNREHGNF